MVAKKKKIADVHSVPEDQALWNKYLKSEIRKNEAKTKMLQAQTLYFQSMTKDNQSQKGASGSKLVDFELN